MKQVKFLLQKVFLEPECSSALTNAQWDLLIRQARATGTLGRLYWVFEKNALLQKIPEAPLAHLNSYHVLVKNQERAIHWEISCLLKAFKDIKQPLILLKGAAYLACENNAAKGRLFSDVDLLVPKASIDKVEKILKFHGWVSGKLDEYDNKYYRTWMHEIPPLQHLTRGTTLDVHHTILPETSRMKPDPKKLFQDKKHAKCYPDEEVYTLCPIDMIIHSATHLFHEGEFETGFRDLSDLDTMIRQYAESETDFWARMAARTVELDLSLPVFFGVRYAKYFFATPAGKLEKKLQQAAKPKFLGLMDFLFITAFAPAHRSCDRWYTPTVRWCLYVRSHYLRMPLHLLVPHLIRKAVKRMQTPPEKPIRDNG